MTIATTANAITYAGNDLATEFSFDFAVPQAGYLEVIITDIDGAQTTLPSTQYDVTGIGDPSGGFVTYPLAGAPLEAGAYITVRRIVPLKQLISISNQGAFYPNVVEAALDFLMMAIQQVNDQFTRAIVAPDTDPDQLLPLPSFIERANQLLGFDGSGQPIVAQPSSALVSVAMQPVVAASTLADARDKLGLRELAELDVGGGLLSDGTYATVNVPFVTVGVPTNITGDDHLKHYIATTSVTLTLARANTYWNGFGFYVNSDAYTVTVAIIANDDFPGQASGASLSIPPGRVVYIGTDAANSGNWYVRYLDQALPIPPAFTGLIIPGGRLTLTSDTPVLSSNVTGQSTVFYTPYLHDIVPLFNGTIWIPYRFTQMSQALSDSTKSPAGAAANSVYDLFVWNDNETLRCTRGPVWSSATARGTGAGTTELERLNGRLVNKFAITNGPMAQRGLYVGTIATNASTQLAMNFTPAAAGGGTANRLDVWNMYNRVDVAAMCRDDTNTWNYTTKTWRAANNSNSNRISYVVGLNEEMINAQYNAIGRGTTAGKAILYSGVGLDSTTAFSGISGVSTGRDEDTNVQQITGIYTGLSGGIGSRFVQALEASTVAGVTEWQGDNNDPSFVQSGLTLQTKM